MSDNERNLKNAIWMTSKVRMLAESKRRVLHYTGFAMVFWYCLVVLCVRLFSAHVAEHMILIPFFLVIGAGLCMAVLVLNYGQKADQYRECYLELEKLLHLSVEDIPRYFHLLDLYPNHTPADYEDFLVNARLQGKKLVDSSGNEFFLTWYTWLSWAFRKLAFLIAVSFTFVFPLIIILLKLGTH
ncbi:hypothetical protein [Candidatus Liberibacter sp.]|uniref:hypothetical protein n=1 Tax=Candidatus Liberibacter sp. TaxID=34022 RepID=UPI0015F6B11A|nr:hypothetical protein [Candidatus Liberibacter sp.]MBA5724602.1 hypothetical protein [Candidatus Liberibacter sp.]